MKGRCCGVPAGIGAPEAGADHRGRSAKAGRRWFGVSGCVAPGVMLALLPKCPACLAAYFAIGMGAGLSTKVAAHLRGVLMVTLVASLIYLVSVTARGKLPGRGLRG